MYGGKLQLKKMGHWRQVFGAVSCSKPCLVCAFCLPLSKKSLSHVCDTMMLYLTLGQNQQGHGLWTNKTVSQNKQTNKQILFEVTNTKTN